MVRITDVVDRLKKMDRLIREGKTGSATNFAKELGISRSHLFNHLEELKDLGVKVSYNKVIGSYEYSGEMVPDIHKPLSVKKR